MQFTIGKDALKACLKFAAKNDIRYYLSALCIEVNADDARIIATDDHCMIVHKINRPEDASLGQWIVPRDFVERATKGNRKLVDITIDGDNVTLSALGVVLAGGKCGDGIFPDYRRVVPETINGELAQFDPLFIGLIGEAAKLLGCRYPLIHHNGEGAAIINFNRDDALAVVMPIRNNKTDYITPPIEWARVCRKGIPCASI